MIDDTPDMTSELGTPVQDVRVWAEERGENTLLLSWQWGDDAATRDRAADARAAAAAIGVRPGVTSATATAEGVLAIYDPAVIQKRDLAIALRAALALEADLKTRSNELLKRAPAYARLARSLALDERVSPVPQAAREAAAARGRATPLRMIPGFPLIGQLATILPVLRSLNTWSREAPPGVVDEHLDRFDLTRETLDRDLATAHEMGAFARAYAVNAAGGAARKATSLAARATGAAHQWLQKKTERP